MKIKIYIFAILGIVLLFFVMLAVLLLSNRTVTQPSQSLPTPTSVSLPSKQQVTNDLTIISVNPLDKSVSVPTSQQITVSFNRPFQENEITFSIAPNVSYSQEIKYNTFTIIPNQALSPGILYTLTVKFPNSNTVPRSFSFTTVGPTQQYLPNTGPGALQQENSFQLNNHPDMFLANKTPYSTNDFSISSDFTQTPNDHFYFSVTLNSDTSKNNFITWLKSLGLSDDQIRSLDIRYQ